MNEKNRAFDLDERQQFDSRQPKCWRCWTHSDLSKHSTTPRGTIRYICRSCRRKLYKLAKLRKGLSSARLTDDKPSDAWRDQAQASRERILRRFA